MVTLVSDVDTYTKWTTAQANVQHASYAPRWGTSGKFCPRTEENCSYTVKTLSPWKPNFPKLHHAHMQWTCHYCWHISLRLYFDDSISLKRCYFLKRWQRSWNWQACRRGLCALQRKCKEDLQRKKKVEKSNECWENRTFLGIGNTNGVFFCGSHF